MRVDLHVHTMCSDDSLSSLSSIIRWVERRKLDCVAITDHNTIAGAVALRELASFPVIIGEEIRTLQGEIIGLFLSQEIPAGLTPRETVSRIREQNGVVYLPHPFDRVRNSRLASTAIHDILADVEMVEVLNSRVTYPRDNREAAILAREHSIAAGAGSDAHLAHEIGRAWVALPAFDDADSFRTAMAAARPSGRISSPLVHLGSRYARLAKQLTRSARSGR